MCNVHLNKMLATASKEKEKTQGKASASLTTATVTPTSLTTYTANGAITPNTPPLLTPTQDPQRLKILKKLKNKFTRVESCPSEDVIVNVIDDSDPYAFSDADTEPARVSVSGLLLQTTTAGVNSVTMAVSATSMQHNHQKPVQTSLTWSGPVESSQKSHQYHPHQYHQGFHSHRPSSMVNTASTAHAESRTALTVTTTYDVKMSVIVSSVSDSILYVSSTSSLLSEPSTPHFIGGTSTMVERYPEIAGKLYGLMSNSVPNTVSSSSGLGKSTKMSSSSNVSPRGKQSTTGSRSSRTMNKLESKIAQNRIKDKQKAKQQKNQTAMASESDITLTMSCDEEVLTSCVGNISAVPTISSSAGTNALVSGAFSSAETTSTIYSLGSIPSLGTFLSQDAVMGSSNSNNSGGSQHKFATLPFPVALPVLSHHMTTSTTSNHVISSSSMATVIPATVFTPFPNLAGALSNLHKPHEAGKQVSHLFSFNHQFNNTTIVPFKL